MPKFVLMNATAGFTGSISDTDSNGNVHSIHFDSGVSRYVTDQDKIWVARGKDCLELSDDLGSVSLEAADAGEFLSHEDALAIVYQRGANGLVEFLNLVGLNEFDDHPVCELIDIAVACSPLWLELEPVYIYLKDPHMEGFTGSVAFGSKVIRFFEGRSTFKLGQEDIRLLSHSLTISKEP
ncbi:hypothetical protein ABXV18_24945 [Vibrio owensii]|uniref:hypothetical protein n=1 Tax=Vibrio owensii TaxID=696485 RepID=UPI003392308C